MRHVLLRMAIASLTPLLTSACACTSPNSESAPTCSTGTWTSDTVRSTWFEWWETTYAEETSAYITSVRGCGFDMMVGDTSLSVPCTIPGVSNGLAVDQTYWLTSCAPHPAVGAPNYQILVFRDDAGELVSLGGTGLDMISDVACLPSGFALQWQDEGCASLSAGACGDVVPMSVRFTVLDEVVDLLPGEHATVETRGHIYDVYNFYALRVVADPAACTDMPNGVASWAVVRRN